MNEHIVGRGWPPVDVRHEMLREAILVIRELWKGGYVSHRGEHFVVEDARVFDLPERPIETFVAAGGRGAARLAADVADGVCVTESSTDIMAAYLAAGGRRETTWGQVVLAWAADDETGLSDAHAQFRFAAGGWKVQAELPNPVNFDAATQTVSPADLAETIPAGPDADRHAEAIRAYLDIGYEHLAVAYPGSDTDGFMQFWSQELHPRL